GRRRREAGLDHVDLEPGELARDLELLGGSQAGARRLLAIAQGRVEDPDAARGDRRAAHRAEPAAAGAALPDAADPTEPWASPASTTTGLRNAICARRSRPTCSIWCSLSCWRRRANSAPPDSCSAIQRLANEPLWMSVRTSFMAVFTPSVIRGPDT